MKLYSIVIISFACLMLYAACLTHADPGDVIISFFIPVAKVAKFQEAYLRANPIKGNLTAKQWVTYNASEHIRKTYERGVKLLATDAATPDPNILGQ